MYSMTGYGKGEYREGGIELTVEIKSVNNRYLDLNVRTPRAFASCEERIRTAVRSALTRGHADVYVSLSDKRDLPKAQFVDENAARGWYEAAELLRGLFPDLSDDFSVTTLMKCPDVVRQEETQGADNALCAALDAALASALTELNAMRAREGKKLADDMLSRMGEIARLRDRIAARAPLVAQGYRAKLEERMREALSGVQVDEGRLLSEAALFADRANIDEELTRLSSHIAQFGSICKEERVGRKLDFLVQEFNREANTICSKSNDLEITNAALALKNEIEKVREQVQNIE